MLSRYTDNKQRLNNCDDDVHICGIKQNKKRNIVNSCCVGRKNCKIHPKLLMKML